MPLTLVCLAVIATSLAVFGIPLQWLLAGRRPLRETDWCLVPFLGLAGIVLPLQNLVYLDIPLAHSAAPLWLVGVLGTAWVLRRGHLRVAAFPWRAFAAAILVFAVQGAGLLVQGARVYMGRAWTDAFNYTAAAEFLMHFPYHLPVEKVITHPWLGWVWTGKEDRIGQSMLQGFWAISSGASAKALFCPTILLTAPLCVLAVYLLARRLGQRRRIALLAGVTAGLVPGVTTIHLDCFLSQAFGVPLLLLFGLLLADVARRPSVGTVGRAGLLLSLALSVYTEFTPLLVGLVALALGHALLRRWPAWGRAGLYTTVLLSPLLLNPYFSAVRLRIVLVRFDMPIHGDIYPWAQTLEGWARAWLGDAIWTRQRGLRTALRVYTVAVTALAFFGLAMAAWRRRAWAPRQWRPRSFPLAAALLAIALLPVAVILKDGVHLYQVQKLLHTASPLLALGVALGGVRFYTWAQRRTWGLVKPGVVAGMPVVVVLAVAATGSARMVWDSSVGMERTRSWAPFLTGPDFLHLQDRLEGTCNGNVLVSHPDVVQRSWLAYFARHNRIWLSIPMVNDANLTCLPRAEELLHFNPPAHDLLIVAAPIPPFVTIDPGDVRRTSSGRELQLWLTRSPAWGLPVWLANPLSLEPVNALPNFWSGLKPTPIAIAPWNRADFWISRQPTAIGVVAGCAGRLILSGEFHPGPSLPECTLRRVEIRTSDGFEAHWSTLGGAGHLEIPVPAGQSIIWLKSLDSPSVRPWPNGPTPVPLLGVKDLCASFRAWDDPSRP